MKTHLMFTLPWPPSVNTYYRTYLGRMLVSAKGRKYRREVIDRIIELGMPLTLLDARLSMQVWVTPPDRRKRDLDNLLKPLIDALQHSALFNDDEQIDELAIFRGPPDKANAGVRIHLAEIVEGE